MTRDELIEALKSAKGPFDLHESSKIALRALEAGIIPADGSTALLAAAMTGEKISIGAAISLVERVRPGWSWKVGVNENHQFPQVVMSRSYPTNKIVTVEAATPALAILIAMLESLNDAKEAK